MNLPRCAASARQGAPLAALVVSALLLTAVQSGSAIAQDPDPSKGSSSRLRIYVGMWSTHFRDLSRGMSNNWLVGLGWRGWYGGTFVNSFGNRSFAAGIQRTVARGNHGAVVPSFGYRVGVVSGYDERFMPLASWIPVLPMAQLLGSLETGRAGLDLGWAGLAATIGPHFRF